MLNASNLPDFEDEDEDDVAECNGCECEVDSEEPYFATPCGTYCISCMNEHMEGCGICADEFA